MQAAMPTQPTASAERIISLDVLRGFALLGILIMNIQAFSMPTAAYLNPLAYGDFSGANYWVWLLSHVFADTKFIAIFSMLFGAGICLFHEHAMSKAKSSSDLHYRRMRWLLVFGLLHAYLFWYGDILFSYAVCGMLLFGLKDTSASKLLITGLCLLSIAVLINLSIGLSMPHWPADAIQEVKIDWQPNAEAIALELAQNRGSWIEQLGPRAEASFSMQTFLFFIMAFWRIGGAMLIGMALYKLGVLSADRSNRFYLSMLALGAVIGLSFILYGVRQNTTHGFSLEYSMFLGSQYNFVGGVFMALAYIALIMLMVKHRWLVTLQVWLANVGKTAFSNYILQTLICTLLFYGHGFGLFGSVERTTQVLIVALIWLLQIMLATLWLRRYRYGPLEWLWRHLTYRRTQPAQAIN